MQVLVAADACSYAADAGIEYFFHLIKAKIVFSKKCI